MSCMEVCPYGYFWWCGYFWGSWESFVVTDGFSVRVTKITSTIGVSQTHTLPFCFSPIFNSMSYDHIMKRMYKTDNFESHNSLKLNFINTWGLCLNFVEYEPFLESNSPDILALCETNLVDSINFSVKNYLSLIRKDAITHMYGLSVYAKEGLPFAQDIPPKNSVYSYLCFQLALLHSVSYFFFLYWSPSSSLCMVFNSVSSNINKVLSVNPSASVFVFGDFNIHHKDWLTYSGGTDRPGELLWFLYLKWPYSDG